MMSIGGISLDQRRVEKALAVLREAMTAFEDAEVTHEETGRRLAAAKLRLQSAIRAVVDARYSPELSLLDQPELEPEVSEWH